MKALFTKQGFGAVALFLGLMGIMGVGGAITDMPPEATSTDWFKVLGLSFNFALLAQVGIWLVKEEI